MMKKIEIILFMFLVASLCYGQEGNKGFTIHGTIQGIDDCKGMFTTINYKGEYVVDTVDIKDQHFIKKGYTEWPLFYILSFSEDAHLANPYQTIQFFIDKGEITYTANLDSNKKIVNNVIEGSKSQKEFQNICDILNPIINLRNSTNYHINKISSGKEKGDLKRMEILSDSCQNVLIKSMLDYPYFSTSNVIPYFIDKNFTVQSNMQTMELFVSKMTEESIKHPIMQEIISDIAREKAVNIGAFAKDFSLDDIEGNNYKLSSYKGKYVLLNFSASW